MKSKAKIATIPVQRDFHCSCFQNPSNRPRPRLLKWAALALVLGIALFRHIVQDEEIVERVSEAGEIEEKVLEEKIENDFEEQKLEEKEMEDQEEELAESAGGDGDETQTSQPMGVDAATITTNLKNDDTDFLCTWSPDHNKQCLDLISNRLPPPNLQPRRWLFFGDSTVSMLFTQSNLLNVLVSSPLKQLHNGCFGHLACDQLIGERCKLNDLFGLPYPEKWSPPNQTSNFAGPTHFGADNPYCTDCSGCHSQSLKCVLLRNSADSLNLSIKGECDASERKFIYGGFVSMEFARDIEIQTPEFLTTQENLAAYIDRVWNTPDMIQEWGKPICVISAGIHDVTINNISTVNYVQNVNFMLTNFISVCEHIIWLGNAAPRSDEDEDEDAPKYKQTIDTMKTWDSAAREVIGTETKFFNNMSFIDVHSASLIWPHLDHVHMNCTWYQRLGNELMLPLMDNVSMPSASKNCGEKEKKEKIAFISYLRSIFS